jgi:hypothetical protein
MVSWLAGVGSVCLRTPARFDSQGIERKSFGHRAVRANYSTAREPQLHGLKLLLVINRSEQSSELHTSYDSACFRTLVARFDLFSGNKDRAAVLFHVLRLAANANTLN